MNRKPFTRYPAVVLCGGRGTRLRPLTQSAPKPLVPLGGRPILSYIIDHLIAEGVKSLVFCVGYKGELVADFAESYCDRDGINITIIDSGEEADIAIRLTDAGNRFPRGFFFAYGDTIADVPLGEVYRMYADDGAVAVVSAFQLKSSFGVMTTDERSAVVQYDEKPLLPYWVNVGYGFLGPEAVKLLRLHTSMESYLGSLQNTGSLFLYQHKGRHITFNTLSEKEEAEDAIRFL